MPMFPQSEDSNTRLWGCPPNDRIASPSNAMVPAGQQAMGYKANFLGQDVVFADEAQYLKVKYAYEQKIGKAKEALRGLLQR